MKFRSFLTALAAIAGVLFLVGTLGFVLIFAQSPISLLRGSPIESPTAAMFIPRQAPVVASLLVNPDRLETLRQTIAKPGDRREARAELDQFKQGILGSTDLDYRRDVQPWLGNEVTAAITALDVDRDGGNGEERGYLLALMTKDPQRSREFLQLFWQKRALAGTDLKFEAYQGTTIISGKVEGITSKLEGDETLSSAPNPLATAVVGNHYVLFANSPKVLKDSINNVQAAELNLASSVEYQRAIATLREGRIGLVFLNLPQLQTLTGKDVSQEGSLAISLGLNRQGLIAETALLEVSETAQLTVSQPTAPQPKLSKPVGALQYIPATSPISASGVDLDQFWTGLSNTAKNYDFVAQLVNQPIESLEKQWNLDLKNDIFSWVKGEYALGLVPQPGKNQPLDWVFVADKSDPSAQAAISHLDAVAQAQGITPGALPLDDQTVNVWTRLATGTPSKGLSVEAQVAGVHTSVDKYEIFATSLDAMNAVLNAKKNGLASNPRFDRAIAPIQTPNNGYFYIDWDTAQPVLKRQFPFIQLVELAGQPLFNHLRSLTISNYGSESGVQRGGAFFQLD
ncbi:MAG: DUF3352 domain-containing protein [Myxacorys chilensis ATA2-1-KO14]|jgi:hypothetical protein|nr:DUF3352 domain-containing protein [Myxacorys chilensis ATA2-1-KO14]